MSPIPVLLVDDNRAFLRILTRFLGAEDEVVVIGTAGNGQEALERAESLRPQVILLDLAMPGLNGLEAIPRLRRVVPDAGIIALTVLDTNGYRQAALAAGADDFVPKAVLNTDLLPAIRRVTRVDRVRGNPGGVPTDPGRGDVR
jgi:DNA-binding NarL/FixJ family response regulator